MRQIDVSDPLNLIWVIPAQGDWKTSSDGQITVIDTDKIVYRTDMKCGTFYLIIKGELE